MDKIGQLKNNHDDLTGLLEKQSFYICAQELIDTAGDIKELAFIFFDMDNFKLFNANYGFETGDELLVEIAKIIQEVCENQLVARFSGDHFVVCTNKAQIINSIAEIQIRVKKIQKNINLELKAGIYVLDGVTTDAIRCSDRARMACASIKKKYDVSYKFYDEELGGSLIRKQYILDNLDEALEQGYIKVYYQPIVRALSGDVCACEALVRWIDPVKGIVYPNEFISVLEEYRFVYKLDSYVIEQVFKDMARLRDEGQSPIPISINLSRIDFEALDIVPYIDELAAKYNINPNRCRFEITEGVLMENPHFIQKQIRRLRDKGYGVWMDDFGSGYSSLNVLKNFEFDLVKIDMEFLRDFDSSDDGKIIIKHLISMIKNLGFHTLAEGVESPEQYEFLKGLGCELIQGYLIGRPMPLDEGMAILDRLGIKYESTDDREFYNIVGKIDLLKQNPLEGAWNSVEAYTLPLSIGIIKNGKWKYIYANEGFYREMAILKRESLEEIEELINNPDWGWLQRNAFWELCFSSKKGNTVRSMEFVSLGQIINIKVRHITTNGQTGDGAYITSIRTLSKIENDSIEHKISIISNYLFSMFECIDIFEINNRFMENIFVTDERLHVETKGKLPKDIIQLIANEKVHEDDREIFLSHMNISDIKERLEKEKNGIAVKYLRILNKHKQYVWKAIVVRLVIFMENEVMLVCVKETTNDISKNMDAYLRSGELGVFNSFDFQSENADQYALDNILKLVPVGVFWKDKERRFVGANRMFLDYYGFTSLEMIKGKTDEDMGWHINPEPFMKDEIDVITEGKIIKNVEGECIVNGEVRKILASKRPFIVDGEIIGLIGFFSDVTEQYEEKSKLENLSNTDQLTGLLNRRAFDSIIEKYISQFKLDETDFAFLIIDIDKFKQINDMYGHDFGDRVLKEAASIIRNITSNSSVAFRIGGDEFAILHQYKSDGEIKSIIQEIYIKFNKINRIGGMDIKVRASVGEAVYSQNREVHALLNEADRKMYLDKEKHK